MSERKSTWDWSLEYVGDPKSWVKRGQILTQALKNEGMKPEHTVLDIGCGNLSEGVWLIRYLNTGNFYGIEPNGWLVNAGMEQHPDLEAKEPQFLFRSDFDATGPGIKYDHVLSHSVLSHAAHWQIPLALRNVRTVVEEGTTWLASYIRGERNGYAKEWVYPGVNTLKIETLCAIAYQCGWSVTQRTDIETWMQEECPNDTHQWVTLRAIPTPDVGNQWRIDEEAREKEEIEIRAIAESEYRRRRFEEDAE